MGTLMKNPSNKKLYERLGIPTKQASLDIYADVFERKINWMRSSEDQYDEAVFDLGSVCESLALNYYYNDKYEEAAKHARMCIDYTIEYFFGKWRDELPIDGKPPDAAKRKEFEPWENMYRESMFWASCLGDWESIKKLSEYPTAECPVGRYEPRLFCIWWLLVAAVIRGEKLEGLSYTKAVEKSRRKYFRLLLSMLRAILQKDSDSLNSSLKDYLDYCKKNTFNRPEIDEKISRDGTFMINWARHKGLEVTYPAEYEDRIVKLH